MSTSELVFIPSPGAGHLPPTLELAKLLIHRDPRISATIIVMNPSSGAKTNTETDQPRLRLVEILCDESTMSLITPHTLLSTFVQHHKPHVRDIVKGIIAGDSIRLAGFVLDMFCVDMIDVANEFGVPTYTYFTSGAAMLGMMFYLQAKRDYEGYDVTELKNSELELPVNTFANPVPAKVLPEIFFDKQGGSKCFLDTAKRFRETKGIVVNTFLEFETHALEHLTDESLSLPPVFAVGPIVNLEKKNKVSDDELAIMRWLDEQPKSSVVFLCFGSKGGFNDEQVKEIALALERSDQRFLWSLHPSAAKGMMGEASNEYENPEALFPKGFLEHTSSVGKVIGWAPQMEVLSHPSIGGFVSHCGWNSTLESMWSGVPMGAWPLYAEQHINAFQLVVELGVAAEVKMDYRLPMGGGASSDDQMMAGAGEIEKGIRKLMGDDEMRKKVIGLKEKSRKAVGEGGSSYNSIGSFIHHVITNTESIDLN